MTFGVNRLVVRIIRSPDSGPLVWALFAVGADAAVQQPVFDTVRRRDSGLFGPPSGAAVGPEVFAR